MVGSGGRQGFIRSGNSVSVTLDSLASFTEAYHMS